MTNEHLKELKISKLSGSDWDSIYGMQYEKENPGKNLGDFRNFQRTPEWLKFLKIHKEETLLKNYFSNL